MLQVVTPAPGAPAAEWGLLLQGLCVLSILLLANHRNRLQTLILSADGLVFIGGCVVLAGCFFRLFYGPWGVEFSVYASISYSCSFAAWVRLGVYLPLMAFGVVVNAIRPWSVVTGSEWWTRLEWQVVALLLTASAIVAIVPFCVHWSELQITASAVHVIAFGRPLLASAGTLIAIVIGKTDARCRSLLYIVSGFWLLMFLWPVGPGVPFSDVFTIFGPGYWMMLLGAVAIVFGSTLELLRGPVIPAGSCQGCGYLLKGLPSARCPECGLNNADRDDCGQ